MATTTPRTPRARVEARRRLLAFASLPVLTLATAIALIPAIDAVGALIVVVPIAVAVGWYIIQRPDHGLYALVFSITVFENDAAGVLGFTDRWYEFAPGLPVQPADILILAIIVGLIVDFNDERRAPRISPWIWLPVPFLLGGMASGVLIGYTAGADLNTLLNSFRIFALLVVMAVMTAITVDRYRLVTRLMNFWFALVTAKCAIGLLGWVLGAGRSLGSTRITFYAPTMNYNSLVLILGVLALALKYGPGAVTRWQWIGLSVATLSLVLAFRRSFWIGLVLGMVLVVLVASGKRGRPWVVLGGALVIAGGALMLNAGGATNSDNPVIQRAEIRDDAEDRYRLDEQTNVFGEIQRHQWTGIGLGVPWEARHPLSLEFGAGRNYTHVAVFFFWLKLGPLGVLGYFALIVATGALGVRLWRLELRHDPRLAAAGLALAIGVLALAVVELTGTFTGASDRFGNAQMLLFGWLSAAVVASEATSRQALEPIKLHAPPTVSGRGRPR